jgi:hypothetical protein
MLRLTLANSAEVRRNASGGSVVTALRALSPVLLLLVLASAISLSARAGGVTFITHGLNGNADGWISGMANRLTNYSRFPGTNATIYKAYFYSTNSGYALTATNVAGSLPKKLLFPARALPPAPFQSPHHL